MQTSSRKSKAERINKEDLFDVLETEKPAKKKRKSSVLKPESTQAADSRNISSSPQNNKHHNKHDDIVETLSFKKLIVGAHCLGQITKINALDMIISLPNQLKGIILSASVESKEDHGYVLSIGMNGINVFLHNKEASHYESKFNDGRPLIVGQLLNVCVISAADKNLIIQVTVNPDIVSTATLSDKFVKSISSLAPGNLIKVRIDRVLTNGLICKYNGIKCEIDLLHLGKVVTSNAQDLRKVFNEGDEITARIVYVSFSNEAKTIRLSLEPHILQLEQSRNVFPIGVQLGELVKGNIIRIKEDVITLSLEPSQIHANLNIGHLSDHLSSTHLSNIVKSLKPGYMLKDLIIISKSDEKGFVNVSNKHLLIEAAKNGKLPKSLQDIEVDNIIPGYVKSITDYAVFIGFLGGFTARAMRHYKFKLAGLAAYIYNNVSDLKAFVKKKIKASRQKNIHFYYFYLIRPNPLPGPLPLPIVGNVIQIGFNLISSVQNFQSKYGDIFEIYMFSERQIWLCNPSLVNKVFTNSTKSNYFRRALSTQGFKELGIDKVGVVFNRDIMSWRYKRRILSYTLTNVRVLKESIKIVKKLFEEIEGYWIALNTCNENDNELMVDLSQWTRRFMTDLALNMNFSEHAFSMASYFNSLSKNKVQQSQEIIESEKFLKSLSLWVQTKIENIPLEKIQTHDILTTLLTVNIDQDLEKNYKSGEKIKQIEESEITGVLLEFFVAGVLTTTCFAIYYICKHPLVKQKLIQELDSEFPELSSLNDMLNYEKLLNNLPYCDAILKETSRLGTNPPINPREASIQDEIDGHIISKGSVVVACTDAIHLHKDYWEKPNEFIPERFLSKDDYPLSYSQKLYTFGSGLRGCIGKQLALIKIKTFLVLLLRKYDIELVNENDSAIGKSYALKVCDRLLVKLKPRKV
ncbi:18605_t:CDS:2 [Gigaspora margarita]|uniref:18605_t:CDS:1 n=1 Tax=Gigaspora margarita TaxID=4874 RepID=A0ABN7UJV2_GIGMA|nr:18605_t:CDS:2 [Gigaspora margarita]